MIRKIEISKNEMRVHYDSQKEAFNVYTRFYEYECRESYVIENVLVYNLTNVKYPFVKLEQILIWGAGETYTYKRNCVDVGKLIENLNLTVVKGNIFRLSLVNVEDDTIGRLEFGCWQFGRLMKISDEDDITITLRNSNMDKFVHKVTLDDRFKIVIDIGKIDF